MERVNGAVLMAVAMLATFWATGVHAHSYGAPLRACPDMGAVHIAFPSKDPATCPFGITFTQTEVNKGSKVNVTLSAHVAHDDPRNRLFQVPGYFTGYLLMAFNAKDEMAGPIGTFSGFNPVHGQHLNCWNRPMSALTHVNANFKSVIHTQWVPPENFVGTVIFRASFTSNIFNIWAAVPAHRSVTIMDTTTTPKTTPAATPMTTPKTTPKTNPAVTPAATPTTTPKTTPKTNPAATPAATPATTPKTTPKTNPAATPAATPVAAPTTTPKTTPMTTKTTIHAPKTRAAGGHMSGSWMMVVFAIALAAMPFLPTM
ncbi:hypothetical protein OUZ56_014152 [Daphnia magna]|uniref:Reelin domain-containing protein n=1 Tax=Daphnia magna TaxID=35525 RepID=A0ABQ9Z932_9CRUS|nr:hypothetical protein OUZ56_014152 [Daphnia magna]